MEENKPKKNSSQTLETLVLFVTIFVVGLCTIVYELLIGSVSSYFLGDSIKQFSITIGLTMAAMGLGTLLSRSIHGNLFQWFIFVEIILGLIGGLSVPILFAAYSLTTIYYPIMITLIVIIGILIGLEIPLLTRIMEKAYVLRENISNVLSLDYLGALGATLLFPFILLPFLGIFKSSLLVGSLNVLIGVFNFWYFRKYIGITNAPRLKLTATAISILLVGMLFWSQNLINAWETNVYEDRVILSKQSAYQKIVLTKHKKDFRLYLDGHLQFSSIDEYRYHESLVHIPLSLMKFRENILVLGGGDGLAVREILKYPDVKSITVVDLDPEITQLGLTNNLFLNLNKSSLKDARVQIKNVDGFKFLEDAHEYYDVIIADLPDPKTASLARLYSKEFYKLTMKKLSKQGIFITQSTSPFFAKKAFWSIHNSVKASGYKYVRPYHTYVPSFGDWGFVMASKVKLNYKNLSLTVKTKYLDKSNIKPLFIFSKDLKAKNIKPSSLNQPIVLTYYMEGWKHWN
ncbi:MAG: polyamine aminopropyltransferase [Nitrospinales bacterium]